MANSSRDTPYSVYSVSWCRYHPKRNISMMLTRDYWQQNDTHDTNYTTTKLCTTPYETRKRALFSIDGGVVGCFFGSPAAPEKRLFCVSVFLAAKPGTDLSVNHGGRGVQPGAGLSAKGELNEANCPRFFLVFFSPRNATCPAVV